MKTSDLQFLCQELFWNRKMDYLAYFSSQKLVHRCWFFYSPQLVQESKKERELGVPEYESVSGLSGVSPEAFPTYMISDILVFHRAGWQTEMRHTSMLRVVRQATLSPYKLLVKNPIHFFISSKLLSSIEHA